MAKGERESDSLGDRCPLYLTRIAALNRRPLESKLKSDLGAAEAGDTGDKMVQDDSDLLLMQ